jgi:hypothetical protein
MMSHRQAERRQNARRRRAASAVVIAPERHDPLSLTARISRRAPPMRHPPR